MDSQMNSKEERTAKYWICDECADKRKWIGPKYAVTCIRGLCGHCERPDETTLTPMCDFDKRDGRAVVWD